MDSKGFVDRINLSLKELHIPKWKFYEDLNLSNNSTTNWTARGTFPAGDTTLRIADYLGVSVRYLVTGNEDDSLSSKERELLEACRGLSKPMMDKVIKEAKDLKLMALEEKKENSHGLDMEVV